MVYSQPFLPNPVRFYGWGFLFYMIFINKIGMGINNVINEELSRMKSLFGYQRGKVISEQVIISEAQTRQENITSIYCGVNAYGYITAPGYVGQNLTFDSWSKGLEQPVTEEEWYTAKASCPSRGGASVSWGEDSNDIKSSGGGSSGGHGASGTWELDDRQAHINSIYCSVKNGIIVNPASYWDGKTWGSYVEKEKLTDVEINVAKKSCPNITVVTTGGGTTGGRTTGGCSLPTELKDSEGVKKFQDWLDKNHVGWAWGYAGEVLNKMGKGYGRMGPRTCKAWSQYKDEYLKSLQIATQDDKNSMTDVTPENGNTAVNNSTNNSNVENGDYNTQPTK